jgi:hypothetical protein
MRDKIGIFIGLVIAIVVVITFSLFAMNQGNFELNDAWLYGILLVVVVSSFYILWDRLKNVQRGLPAKDERVILINYKAAYYGFLAAIWSAVGGPLLYEIVFDQELKGNYVTAIVVLFSGLVFISSYLYLSRKGEYV